MSCPLITWKKVSGPISLKDKAYAALKEAILSLKLKPGVPLVETQVAQELGMSKTPVRAALQELEREGFVTRILFKGTYVTKVTVKDVVEIFLIRAVLKGLAARLATPLFSSQELDQIEHNLTAAEAALTKGDLALCSKLGKSLHDALISKADSQRLVLIIRNLDENVQRFRAISDQISGRLKKSVKEHRRAPGFVVSDSSPPGFVASDSSPPGLVVSDSSPPGLVVSDSSPSWMRCASEMQPQQNKPYATTCTAYCKTFPHPQNHRRPCPKSKEPPSVVPQ